MIGERYLEQRSALAAILGSLIALAQQTDAPAEITQPLRDLLSSLTKPLTLVVVGEVKAGKSSLLNALFGQEFCKADVLPATDRIYVFKYGEQARDVPIAEHLTERYLPIKFLKDYQIVDTPGTNTIVANHQAITEGFIPVADLILFVFSITNPWAASAWDMLRLIGQQWRKNLVFVLQQSDLRDPGEVAAIIRHLDQTILQILGSSRPVFAVSAKKALEAKLSGEPLDRDPRWSESRFGALEAWITRTVQESEARGGKIDSIVQTAQVLLTSLRNRIHASLEMLRSDQEKLAQIRGGLEARKARTLRHLEGFVREFEVAYDACRERGEALLEQRLSVGHTLKMLVGAGGTEKEFQDEVQSELKAKLQGEVEHAVTLLESDLRSIWQDLQERVHAQFTTDPKKAVRTVMPGFLSQRQHVLQRLELTLLEQTSDARIKQQLQSLFGETTRWLRIPTGVAAAGGIFTIIAALTHTAILDVTGTLAGVAALSGTLYAIIRRRKTLREYRRQMDEKRAQLTQAIEQQLRQSIDLFYQEIGQMFAPLESFCTAEAQRHLPIQQQLDAIEQQLLTVRSAKGAQ
ncbi:MAG: dynamin family protein [Verrucomicrobia bacterium]|nr:dynamin family protein [Verrucomicrobiota bacterium]